MPKEISYLHVRISPKLKQQFEQICQEREISISDATRDLVANLVRSYNRQNGKTAKVED